MLFRSSTANLICAKEQCSIPIVTMVRPRGGGFCYSQDEYETMLLDARILLEHGADGIAFGFLTEDHAIHRNRTQEMMTSSTVPEKKLYFTGRLIVLRNRNVRWKH